MIISLSVYNIRNHSNDILYMNSTSFSQLNLISLKEMNESGQKFGKKRKNNEDEDDTEESIGVRRKLQHKKKFRR